jgi:hypothetical protein
MDRDYLKTRPKADMNGDEGGSTRTCLGCDYALEGLGEAGKCPECGTDFGAELVFVGFRTPMAAFSQGLGVLGMLLLTTLLIIKGGVLDVFSLLSLIVTVGLAIRARRLWVARRERGGDMKWIVNERGIMMNDSDKAPSSKTRQLLPWKAIKSIRCRQAIGIGPRRWQALEIQRTFLSIDIASRRDAPIWFRSLEKAEIEARREQVEAMMAEPTES